jgi:hypothetical protein
LFGTFSHHERQSSGERHLRAGAEALSRDRGGGYGEAVAKALPDALQVADTPSFSSDKNFITTNPAVLRISKDDGRRLTRWNTKI